MKRTWPWLLALVLLSGVAFAMGSYQNDVYRKLLLWITLALGYNFLFGIAGQVAFSHFSFYGLGAYSVVIGITYLGWPLPLAILATRNFVVVVHLNLGQTPIKWR